LIPARVRVPFLQEKFPDGDGCGCHGTQGSPCLATLGWKIASPSGNCPPNKFVLHPAQNIFWHQRCRTPTPSGWVCHPEGCIRPVGPGFPELRLAGCITNRPVNRNEWNASECGTLVAESRALGEHNDRVFQCGTMLAVDRVRHNEGYDPSIAHHDPIGNVEGFIISCECKTG